MTTQKQDRAQPVAAQTFTTDHLEGLANDLDRYTERNPGCSYFTNNDGARVRWLLAMHAADQARTKELEGALEEIAKDKHAVGNGWDYSPAALKARAALAQARAALQTAKE